MPVSTSQVSVGDTATLLKAGSADVPESVTVFCPSGNGASVFIGGSDVSTSNGLELAAGASWQAIMDGGAALYGIVATGTETATVLQFPAPRG